MKMLKKSRKAVGVGVVLLAMAGSLSAAIITQEFDTGAINPGSAGSPSITVFDVARFDDSLGTLTRVTFIMSLETWGGSYSVQNITANPEASVNGSVWVGANSYLYGLLVPAGSPGPLSQVFAGETDSFVLPENGDSFTMNGPASDNRNVVGPESDNASSGNFAFYEGAGTYEIQFVSSAGSRHEASGAVSGSFVTMSSQGYLTVEYEYEPIPEPTTLGLVLLGVGALAVRRRIKRKV